MTKQERVYRAIRERILRGTYGPGYRVVIDQVASEFEVSALPVREAIRRLEAEGLIVFRPNSGAQVAPAEPGVFDEELTVLAVLEGYATALAAPEMGDEEIDRLRQINDDMVDAMEHLDSLRFGALNQEFHAVVYDNCPNQALVDMLRDVAHRLDAIRRTVFVQIPYRGSASVSEHRQLIELIERRAPAEEIETAARAHKLQTVASFQVWREEHQPPGSTPPAAKRRQKAKRGSKSAADTRGPKSSAAASGSRAPATRGSKSSATARGSKSSATSR